jgi:hypothetical protein
LIPRQFSLASQVGKDLTQVVVELGGQLAADRADFFVDVIQL